MTPGDHVFVRVSNRHRWPTDTGGLRSSVEEVHVPTLVKQLNPMQADDAAVLRN